MLELFPKSISSIVNEISASTKKILGSFSCSDSPYVAATQLALGIFTVYAGYQWCNARLKSDRVNKVQNNLRKELFKRLPENLKSELVQKSTGQPISYRELALLRGDPRTWGDIETIRKIAIQASLEESIHEKELSYVMLYCMAYEMKEKIPGFRFNSTYGMPQDALKNLIDSFCKTHQIAAKILGNPASREDAFVVVQKDLTWETDKPYHYTGMLSELLYPYQLTDQSGKKFLYLFSPHIIEKILAYTYPEMPEKPLFALGTRKIEKFSDNTQRVLSMTGGSTLPTPHIEANEALSLPFYLHDCYHLDIDSAMGRDRMFWNAFGKHLLNVSKTLKEADMQKAFQALGGFCLDREFAYYKQLEKNEAFVLPLLGLYMIAGKQLTDDKDDTFQLIKDEGLVNQVRKELMSQFHIFWRKEAPQLKGLRHDLEKEKILQSLPKVKAYLSEQKQFLPADLEVVFCSLNTQ